MRKDMPFTGIGLNTFPLIQSEFYTGYLIGPEPHAHNLFLQTALDLGLPGLIAFLWFLAAWVSRVLKQIANISASGYRLLLIGVLAGVGSYLAHGFIDAMMLGAKPSFVIWVLLGIGAAAMPENAPKTKANRLSLYWSEQFSQSSLVLRYCYSRQRVHEYWGSTGTAHAAPLPRNAGASTGSLEQVRLTLEKVLELDLASPQAHLLLARLASSTADFITAQNHYDSRVALDLQSPIFGYNPVQGLLMWFIPQAKPDPARELM
jgi:hypothetical protein